MEKIGIYTLANDGVYDQLVALLNSIEVNVSPDIPVCIIPYDDRIAMVKQEVDSRPNVTLFNDNASIERWENFAQQVWKAHPKGSKETLGHPKWYKKSNLMRKMSAFDGNFEQFVFYDADSLAMSPLNRVWEKLNSYDFVFDDWEHAKPTPVAVFDFNLVNQAINLPESEIRPKIHCSSFFGSKRSIFNDDELEKLKEKLVNNQEIAWINELSWWCDADLFSYMTLRDNRPLFNFTKSEDGQDRTGNCANGDPFVNIENVLYNEQGLKPIHRLHYMNYSASDFARLCKGEDIDINYRDEFLYYRFLKEPEKRPQEFKQPGLASKTNIIFKKIVNKVKMAIS